MSDLFDVYRVHSKENEVERYVYRTWHYDEQPQVAVADFNGDGLEDKVVINGDRDKGYRLDLYEGRGADRKGIILFSDPITIYRTEKKEDILYNVNASDTDGDGDIDLTISLLGFRYYYLPNMRYEYDRFTILLLKNTSSNPSS